MFTDWIIVLTDLLLSGNESKIQAAHNLIDYRVFTRAREEWANNREVR